MLPAIARRVSAGLATLALLATTVFGLAHAMPGGPAYAILGFRATPDADGTLNKALGLDTSLLHQYGIWVVHLLHGNLGTSFTDNGPVTELLAPYIANSLRLYGAGLALALALALARGLATAAWNRRPGTPVLETLLYALPAFVTATLLVALFASTLHWLPAAGDADLRAGGDRLRHLVLPTITVAVALMPPLSRYFLQGLDEAAAAPFAQAALARGLTPTAVLFRHVLPNALRPLITMLGLTAPVLLTGSVMIESVFAYPGLGWLLWRATLAQDYPVILAIVLLGGAATILANLAADLLLTWLDPRARFD